MSLLANVLEPSRGTVLDPACGSAGMFVQSARIVERQGQSPSARLTFRGLEKNATTIRLAKMNLAVHGLEGDIQKAITYYKFYTRTVPCELWFLNRAKPKALKNKVLMIDARNVYRKVTRKIYDFSPEQQQNLLAIVWLYRGETGRFLSLASQYLGQVIEEGRACFEWHNDQEEAVQLLPDFLTSFQSLADSLAPFLNTLNQPASEGGLFPADAPHAETLAEFQKEQKLFTDDVQQFQDNVEKAAKQWEKAADSNAALNKLVNQLEPVAEASRDLIKQADLVISWQRD